MRDYYVRMAHQLHGGAVTFCMSATGPTWNLGNGDSWSVCNLPGTVSFCISAGNDYESDTVTFCFMLKTIMNQMGLPCLPMMPAFIFDKTSSFLDMLLLRAWTFPIISSTTNIFYLKLYSPHQHNTLWNGCKFLHLGAKVQTVLISELSRSLLCIEW